MDAEGVASVLISVVRVLVASGPQLPPLPSSPPGQCADRFLLESLFCRCRVHCCLLLKVPLEHNITSTS